MEKLFFCKYGVMLFSKTQCPQLKYEKSMSVEKR